MAIARRDLLGLGAAMAVAAATSSCRGDRPSTPRGAPTPSVTTTPTPSPTPSPSVAPSTSAFAERPPPGSLYYGASLPYDGSLPDWEQQLGASLAVHRSYFTPDHDETAQLVQQCRDDLAHGRLPHVSMKPLSTWQDIAAGLHDDWLASMLVPLGDDALPVLFTLHHEPENNAGAAGMQASDYVAMQRRLIGLAADLAPRVTIVPVLQHWTFDPLNGRADPAVWLVDDASVIGLDLYNPWSPTNGKPWRSFGSKADDLMGWVGDTPIAIGEYGCRDDPSNPGLAAEWLRDAAQYAREHNIISMSYFNSHLNAPDGSWELDGRTEQVFADLLASDWVARPA